MTELRIYELLNELNEPAKQGPLKMGEHSKLIPEHVASISRSIANAVYDTLKDKSSHSSKRLDYIQLLRRWCVKDDKHFSVNADNYTCFLDCIDSQLDRGGALDKFLRDELRDITDVPEDAVLADVLKHYKEKDEERDKEIIDLDYVAEMDQKNLGGFDYTIPRNFVSFDSTDTFLRNTFDVDTEQILHDHTYSTAESSRENAAVRRASAESRVKLAYALLNLPKTEQNLRLITSVFDEIAEAPEKLEREIELIEHVHRRADDLRLSVDWQLDLLKKFPFLYEVPLIRICTKLLSVDDPQERAAYLGECRSGAISNVTKLSSSCGWLRVRIVEALYELFALSNYNVNILYLIRSVK